VPRPTPYSELPWLDLLTPTPPDYSARRFILALVWTWETALPQMEHDLPAVTTELCEMRSCRFHISAIGPAHLGALGPRNTFTENRRIRADLAPSFFFLLFMRYGL